MLRLLGLVGLLLGGCGDALCVLIHHNPEVISQCKLGGFDDPWEPTYAERQHERAHDDELRAQAARNAAAPVCALGDAHACLTVAVYDDAHDRDPRTTERAYATACRGGLALGCYGAGKLAADGGRPAIALPYDQRGCALGERLACESAAALDPVHAVAFREAACTLRDYHGCTRAGFAYLYGVTVPADRDRAVALLTTACRYGEPEACSLLPQRSKSTAPRARSPR